jgi:hypothetical protein
MSKKKVFDEAMKAMYLPPDPTTRENKIRGACNLHYPETMR